MSSVAHPVVWRDDNGYFHCRMKDRDGRTWGEGTGESRTKAITQARYNAPQPSKIKRALGWAYHHPLTSTFVIGTYAYCRRKSMSSWQTIKSTAVAGAIGFIADWAVKKVVRFFKRLAGIS